MAPIKCKECGNEIAKSAKACPKCGAKVKRTSVLTWIVGGFFVLLAIQMVSHTIDTGNEKAATSAQTSTSTFTAPSPFTLARDGYFIKGSSHSFPSGEIDIQLDMLFKKRPTTEQAYSILSSEVAGYIRQIGGPPKVEVVAYVLFGRPE